MAKKIRFPLEMENGIEVRSMEELRNNFALGRVLEYVQNEKLVIWLRDRYENNIADAIAELDKMDPELPRKVSEIFDIPYDEKTEDDLKQAAERAERIKRLEEFTDEKQYADKIDNVAFDQDELYDLLDEEVNEIFLCGDRFAIPLSVKGISYKGINNPVVVIDSKTEVDWLAKEILLEAVRYDDKYQAVVDSANATKEVLYEKLVETLKKQASKKISIESIPEKTDECENIDASEVADLVNDLLELLSEFSSRDYENEDDELYEYDYSIECDAEDYNDYGYETKAKAKAACKNAITLVIEEARGLYEDAKTELVDCTRVYYRPMYDEFTDFINDEFMSSIDDLVDVYCSEETKNYVMAKKSELIKCICGNNGWLKDVAVQCEKQFECLVKEAFDDTYEKSINVKNLFNMCEYEDDSDGEYSFSVEDACNYMIDVFTNIIETEVENFPERVAVAYMEIRANYVSKIAQWIKDLQR